MAAESAAVGLHKPKERSLQGVPGSDGSKVDRFAVRAAGEEKRHYDDNGTPNAVAAGE